MSGSRSMAVIAYLHILPEPRAPANGTTSDTAAPSTGSMPECNHGADRRTGEYREGAAMEIVDAVQKSGAQVRKIYDHEAGQVLMVTLEPGENLRRHSAPVDIFIYLLEGCGVIIVGDERADVRSGHLIPCSAGTPHAVENTGSGILRALVVKLGAT